MDKKEDQNSQKKQPEKKEVQKNPVPENNLPKKAKFKINSRYILLAVNVILLAVSVFFIISLPKKAAALNQARSDEQKVKESKNVDVTGLENPAIKQKVDTLKNYYPEEPGLIKFIEQMDEMKSSGQIKDFSIVGKDPVKDKTGTYGIPFIAEIEGTWDEINLSLQAIQKLPYLVRGVNVEAKVIGTNDINFKYGGLLYVADDLAKTR